MLGWFSAEVGPKSMPTQLHRLEKWSINLNKKLKYRLKRWSVFSRFPANLGPKTPPDGSGSKDGAERTYNRPRRPILMGCSAHLVSGSAACIT